MQVNYPLLIHLTFCIVNQWEKKHNKTSCYPSLTIGTLSQILLILTAIIALPFQKITENILNKIKVFAVEPGISDTEVVFKFLVEHTYYEEHDASSYFEIAFAFKENMIQVIGFFQVTEFTRVDFFESEASLQFLVREEFFVQNLKSTPLSQLLKRHDQFKPVQQVPRHLGKEK